MIKVQIGRLLGERRESIRAMSRITGISYPAAYRLTAGKTQGADFETLDKLCRHFGVTPNEILEYLPEMAP